MDNNVNGNSENTPGAGRENITPIGKDVRADVHSAIDRAAEKMQPAADRLAQGAHAGVDRVADSVNQMSGQMASRSRQLADSCRHYADTSRDYVRARPAMSVLLAAAAGYGLSRLLGTRRH